MEWKAFSQSSWLSSDQQKVQSVYCCNCLCVSKSSDSQQNCQWASDKDQPLQQSHLLGGERLFSPGFTSLLFTFLCQTRSVGEVYFQSGVSAALAVSRALWLAPRFPPFSVHGQCLCLVPVGCRTSCPTWGCSFNHRNQAVVRRIPTTICGQLLLQCCCSVPIVKGKLPTLQKKSFQNLRHVRYGERAMV